MEKSAKPGTAGTTLTWLFSNLEGTVDVQTVANATGTTTRTFRDPYGAPIGASNGVWSSGTGYMNKPVTASTGLTTVGARTYDPVLGKFLSVDPVIDTNLPQQNTGYTYSGNNPTTYMDPSGLRLDPGCGWGKSCTKTYAAPPRYESSHKFGTQLTNYAASIRKTSDKSDARARALAYVADNLGSFYKSEQGAFVRAWMSGRLPQHITFGEDSKITQGLRDSSFMQDYQARVRDALRSGAVIPSPLPYEAELPSVSNQAFLQDIATIGNWKDATNTERSLAVVGSYEVLPPVVSITSENTVAVTYSLRNNITVGSMVSLTDQLRRWGNSLPGETGPFSAVQQTYTWTDEVSLR